MKNQFWDPTITFEAGFKTEMISKYILDYSRVIPAQFPYKIRHRAVGTSGVSDPSRTSCLLALAFDSVLILPFLGTHTARPGVPCSLCFRRFFANAFWAPPLTLKLRHWIAKVSKSDPK